jgi:hypothetical protein
MQAENAGDPEGPVDPFIAVFSNEDGNCELIETHDDSEGGWDPQLVLALEARDYLIGVKSIGGE